MISLVILFLIISSMCCSLLQVSNSFIFVKGFHDLFHLQVYLFLLSQGIDKLFKVRIVTPRFNPSWTLIVIKTTTITTTVIFIARLVAFMIRPIARDIGNLGKELFGEIRGDLAINAFQDFGVPFH